METPAGGMGSGSGCSGGAPVNTCKAGELLW